MTTEPFAFLFDIGNVLLNVDFDSSLHRLFPEPPADLPLRFMRVMERKDELESGRMAPDVFLDEAIQDLGYSGTRDEFLESFRDRPASDIGCKQVSDDPRLRDTT